MTQLFERVESLLGPDRPTDTDIALACGWHRLSAEYGASAGHWVSPLDWQRKQEWDDWVSSSHLPRFTESIDAAVTLLPKASLWSVCDMEDGPYAQVIRPMPGGGYINGLTTSKAITPALALCGAALRAHALSGKDGSAAS